MNQGGSGSQGRVPRLSSASAHSAAKSHLALQEGSPNWQVMASKLSLSGRAEFHFANSQHFWLRIQFLSV